MEKYHIRISSGSTPPGQEPYFVSLSPYDEVGKKRYETEEDLRDALTHCVKGTTTQAGIDDVIKQIAQKGSIVVEAELTQESAKRLGWHK
jgi:hypothetical protein